MFFQSQLIKYYGGLLSDIIPKELSKEEQRNETRQCKFVVGSYFARLKMESTMDTATIPISEAENSESELIEKLLEYSESESQEIVEDRENVVFTSSWEEAACGWKKTARNVRYISSADRKTKAKEKYCQGTSDSESHYAKVKRLAGMIANSHSSAAGGNEMRNSVKGGSWAGNRAMRSFQNADVLSYDSPCWRYIIDPRTLQYVDRTPLQVLRNLSTSHKYPNQTLILENGGMITFQETYDGGIAINDPALSFDRRLLGGLRLDEDKELYGGKVTPKFPSSLERSMSLLTQCQCETNNNKIRVIQALPPKKQMNSIFPSELCKLRPHDLTKTDSYRGDCNLEVRNHTNNYSELKPLQKITATQRQTAEEGILAKTNSEKNYGRSKENKALNQKRKTGPGGEGKLDWLPITRSTIGYPYPSTTSVDTSHKKSPERLSTGFPKPFSIQRHIKKGKKLTLSEAANLVPRRANVDHALERLSQELDKKMNKGLPVSETFLPSVSGTKLEVPTLVNLWDV